MSNKEPRCENCWHSNFKTWRGETVLYCNFHNRKVPMGSVCEQHQNYFSEKVEL